MGYKNIIYVGSAVKHRNELLKSCGFIYFIRVAWANVCFIHSRRDHQSTFFYPPKDFSFVDDIISQSHFYALVFLLLFLESDIAMSIHSKTEDSRFLFSVREFNSCHIRDIFMVNLFIANRLIFLFFYFDFSNK